MLPEGFGPPFEWVAERLCTGGTVFLHFMCVCASAYVSVSKSIHANVVLNVNFWSVLFTLVVSVEVPFACNIVRKCCNQPHLLCLLASPFYLHPLCPLFIIKPQLSIWTLYTLTFTQNLKWNFVKRIGGHLKTVACAKLPNTWKSL